MAMPIGVQATLDDAFEDDENSQVSGSDDLAPRDVHRERFGRYVPPHERGHIQEEGDQFVNFRDRNPALGSDPDKVEGVDHDKYQKLKLNVNFAIGFDLIKKVMRPQFPGIFFHCAGNTNHDHPVSHMVTQIGTRFLQRRIHPGAVVMDVYGNPNACERFNRSQAVAKNPKHMTALVHNYGTNDFIREVNKWGPILGEDGQRYINKSLKQAIADGDCDGFDTYTMIHTMYYQNFHDIKAMLQTASTSGKTKRLLSLVHRHVGERGSINNGEQEFEVKQHPSFQGGLLKQRNVKTNSVYVHPNLTPVLFSEVKEWFPSTGSPLEMRDMVGRPRDIGDGIGLTWECHLVNEDTWIIEMVLCDNRHHSGDEPSYAELWDDDKIWDDDALSTPMNELDLSDRIWDSRLEWLPAVGKDRDFIRLDLVSKPLFDKLRLSVAGKTRDKKVFADLVREAKHLTSPSALFGDKDGMRCPPEKVLDHVIAAFLVDYEKEGRLMEGMIKLKPFLVEHAASLGFGSKYKDLSFRNVLGVIRSGLSAARTVNGVVRSRDPIDAALGAADGWLEPA